jgi:hypothetical protein
MNRQTLIKQLNGCIRELDASTFVELCQAAKAHAVELIHLNRCVDAGELMKTYGDFMESLKSIDPDFLLNILDVYPDNHVSTLMLLGATDEVDQAITSKKIDTRLPLPIAGSDRLVLWALKQKNLSYIEEVVSNVCQTLRGHYADDDAIKSAVSDLLVEILSYRQKAPYLSSALLDDQISSIVTAHKGNRLRGEVVGVLAEMRMPKTLMAMLENHRLGLYFEKHNDNFSQVLACLPAVMTTRQIRAVLFHLEPKGFVEHVFFDESVDLGAFLEAMKDSDFKAAFGKGPGIYSLMPFVEHITEENFAVPAKKARIIQLLNAACEGQFAEGTHTVKEIRGMFFYADVPEFTWKYITRFKALQLEDALGL